MRKIRSLVVFAVVGLVPVLMGASECNLGGKPAQSADCEVAERAQNSKGVWYVRITCATGDPGVVEVLTGPEQYPACVVTAFWPECKEAK